MSTSPATGGSACSTSPSAQTGACATSASRILTPARGSAGTGYPERVKRWTRRGLAGLAAVLAIYLYFQAATRLEERALAAQQPAAVSEDAAARHVDRDQLMRDVTALAAP